MCKQKSTEAVANTKNNLPVRKRGEGKEIAEYTSILRKLMRMDEKCFNILKEHITYRKYTEDTVIIRPGEIDFNIYIVLKGMGASYCINRQGDCKYLYLPMPGYILADIHNLYKARPAKHYFEMMKGSVAAIISSKTLKDTAMYNPEVASWYITVLIRGMSKICERLEGFISTNAKERLMNLSIENPEIFSKVRKKQIAGFLGIDQSTLSRLLSTKA